MSLHNPIAEKSLLGQILRDNTTLPKVASLVLPEDFYQDKSKQLFEIMLRLHREKSPICMASLHDKVDMDALLKIAEEPPSGTAEWNASTIRGLANKRKLLRTASQIVDRYSSGAETNGLLEEAAGLIRTISSPPTKARPKCAADYAKSPPTPLDYVIRPLLSKGKLSIIQGRSKGGKSSFATYLALCAAGGLPIPRFKISKTHNVLYIAYEDGDERFHQRLVHYGNGMEITGLPDSLFILFSPTLILPRDKQVLSDYISETSAEFVIIDTLSYVHAADENAASEMKLVMESLREICVGMKVSILLVHHTRKTGQAGDMGSISERGRGSSAIAAAADTIIEWGNRTAPNQTACELISKDDDSDEFEVLYSRKDNAVSWNIVEGAVREDTLQMRIKTYSAVVELLKTFPSGVSRSQVSESINMSKNTAAGYLDALVKENKLMAFKEGLRNFYKLPENYEITDQSSGPDRLLTG